MKKEYDIEKYINTVLENENFFKSYYYHSIIDLNPLKLDSILKYGILSKNNIEKKNAIALYTHDKNSFECKNGNNFVSLVDYNKMELNEENVPYFNRYFQSFALHTLTSLSIMVNNDIEVFLSGKLNTLFDDEVFVSDKVLKKDIKGIFLPEHLATNNVSKIPILGKDICYYKLNTIDSLLDYMEYYFQTKIDRKKVLLSVKNLWNLYNYNNGEISFDDIFEYQQLFHGEDLKDIISNQMSLLWQERLKIDNPTYLDVIKYINNDKYPIYEITQKKLLKIN